VDAGRGSARVSGPVTRSILNTMSFEFLSLKGTTEQFGGSNSIRHHCRSPLVRGPTCTQFRKSNSILVAFF
jgi:hypothetical protein